jgi:hypothetical protein
MAIPSRQIGGSTRTNLLWQISKQLEELICVRSGGCGQITTTTSTTYIPATLGCVYYTDYFNFPYTLYSYDVNTNTSTPVVIPTGDEIINYAETHTANRYWKGNQTSLIREWVPTSNPNVFQVNRNIPVSGIVSSFGNYFNLLEAVDDNHLLTIVLNGNPQFVNTLTLLDITSGAVTASEITPLFNIYAPAGIDSFMLTSTNKILSVGRRDLSQFDTNVYFLMQYSYPDGALELEISLDSIANTTSPGEGMELFEYGGRVFLAYYTTPYATTTTRLYTVNLTSPYALTLVNTLPFRASFNSSINCNTVNFTALPLTSPIPSPASSLSPTPTPSPSTPTFKTIYKYLNIQ